MQRIQPVMLHEAQPPQVGMEVEIETQIEPAVARSIQTQRMENLSGVSLDAFFPEIVVLPPMEKEKEPNFTPLAISLPPALQQHTWEMCKKHATKLPHEEFFDIVLRVMWHESRYRPDIPDNRNRNGSIDRGLMQINSVNWNRLKTEHGLDINDPEQNIEAGVLMLSSLITKYPVEHALTAYALGEAGAERVGGSGRFSNAVMSTSLENTY